MGKRLPLYGDHNEGLDYILHDFPQEAVREEALPVRAGQVSCPNSDYALVL